LKRLPDIVARRRETAAAYHSSLQNVPGLKLPSEPDWARSNWQSYCVGLPDDCNQMETMQALLDRGIATRRGIMCVHREPAYQKQSWRSAGPLFCSEQAQDRSILLPLYPQMNEADRETVEAALKQVLTPEYAC